MTQWLRDQTEHQRVLDLNREFRERIGTLGERIVALEQENALLEADNAKMMANLAYDPKDAW